MKEIRNKKMITGKKKVGWADIRKQNKHEKDHFIPLKKRIHTEIKKKLQLFGV